MDSEDSFDLPPKPINLLPSPVTTSHTAANRLTVVPLAFLIFFSVAGGPYGSEPAVQAAGPLFALIAFAVFPFVWSVPESLVTAELSAALPGNGGFVLWAERAFGRFPGSLLATWKYLSGVINLAAFPALLADYLARVFPAVAAGGARTVTIFGLTVILSLINYTGLSIVGWTSVALGVASLLPFIVMSAASIPKLHPERWLLTSKANNWTLFFNTLFWNLNFWDSTSTMAGEVDQPERTFPLALVISVVMTSLGYLLPLMAGIGATSVSPEYWVNGFFADAAGIIAGDWLKYWVEIGAGLSAIGLFEAALSGCSFQLMGMADLGLLPRFFALRAARFDTPWVGILLSGSITAMFSFVSFDAIVASANSLYSLGMLLEFASFIWLRIKHPNLHRPYRVPLGPLGLTAMCLVPSVFLIFVMLISGWKVLLISGGFTVLGVAVYFTMEVCREKGWFKFSSGEAAAYQQVSTTTTAATTVEI